jgi:hypothetical protein
MKPQAPPEVTSFVENELGKASSHPYFARWKAKWLYRVPAWVLGLLLIWIAWKGIHFEIRDIVDALQGRSWFVLAALCLLVFTLSLAATAILSIRASATVGLDALKKESSIAYVPIQSLFILVGGVILTAVLFFFMPRWIPGGLVDPAKAKKYAFIAIFLPYVLTLALFDFFTPGRKRSLIWALLFLVGLIVTGSLLAISLRAEWAVKTIAYFHLQKLPRVGPQLGSLAGASAEFFFRVLAAAICFLTVYALGEWTLSGIPVEDEQREKQESPAANPKGPLARIWSWFSNLFKKASGASVDEGTKEKQEVPQWLEQLCKSLPSALPKYVAGPPLFPAPTPIAREFTDNPSPLAQDTSRNLLFGGVHPTDDQLKALDLFLQRGQPESAEEENAVAWNSCDLLLEGDNGVGKTTTLIACALQTLLIKGERAVIFAPDATTRLQVVDMLRCWLEGLQVHYFFDAGELHLARFSEWLQAPAKFPDILVASPEAWEHAFFGELCDELKPSVEGGLENSVRLWHWLHSVTTFLVDDVANVTWTAQQVMHLPFLIDKQRLLLAAAGRKLQLLATTTRLEELSPEEAGGSDSQARSPMSPVRETLMARLFGEAESPRLRHNYTIVRKWQRCEPTRVEIACLAADPVLFHLIRRGLRLQQQVIAYLPEGDPEQREKMREEFRFKMRQYWEDNPDAEGQGKMPLDDSPNNLRIVCHVNQEIFHGTGEERERILIYRGSLDDSIRPQLFSRYGSEMTVVIALRHVSTQPMPTKSTGPMGYPLLVARDAVPLAAAHLRSAAVHLQAGIAIPRDALAACGVGRVGMVPTKNGLWATSWARDRILRFKLDPADSHPSDPASSDNAWPMACFAPEEAETRDVLVPSRKVDPDRLLQFGAGYSLDDEGLNLEFGISPDETQEQRRAIWVVGGKEIAGVDLAFVDELLVGRAGQMFWCRKLQRDARQRLIFFGEPYRALPSETTAPYWRINLKARFGGSSGADTSAAESGASRPAPRSFLGVDGPWQGTPEGVQVAELYLAAQEKMDMSTVQVPAFSAEIAITGSMSPETRKRSAGFAEPAAFSYPAAVTAVLFDANLPEEDPRKAIAQKLSHDWNTENGSAGGEFWPELTLALQTGLRRFAPRCTQFCRLAGFRLKSGGAVVFFIEPFATAGTMRPLIKALMDYPALAKEKVIDPALEAMATQAWSGPGFTHEAVLDAEGAERILKMLSGTRFRVPLKESAHLEKPSP